MKLRPTQQEILRYSGGLMAVSAVPGSGKTFTLTQLAAQLIAEERIDPTRNQQVLVVTYLNASVDNFKARIHDRLAELGLNPERGYDVRTLHSLGLEIVRLVQGGERGNDLIVLDEGQSRRFLTLAVDNWIEAYPMEWASFLPDQTPQAQTRWRTTVEKTAAAFIRTAKNERYAPEAILGQIQTLTQRLKEEPAVDEASVTRLPFLNMLAGIFSGYQAIIKRQGALDFNDLIGQAVDLVVGRPDVADLLRQRWPFVLEDEAQDSVPLQEILLSHLVGEGGNWVRVGDPNQAITSTFTAAHPRYLNAFLDREDVQNRPLPHSGRCAPKILAAANRLVHWACDHHPVPEVRQNAFRRQDILPTPVGDGQQNPPDKESRIVIKVYKHREDEELPNLAHLAHLYTQKRPHQTVAILVPTNDVGHKIAEHLDRLEASYDNLLRGGTREREIATALHALLALLADPLRGRLLHKAYLALYDINHPAATVPDQHIERFEAVLRSVVKAEKLLYPQEGRDDILEALPKGVVQAPDLEHIGRFINFLQNIFPLRLLPIDDLIIALSDEVFAFDDKNVNETDLAIAYQIANVLRSWYDLHPHWRLPELVNELAEIAEGRRHLSVVSSEESGYDPQPGRISLTTQHGAKGLEWDGVFLAGIDGMWIPGTLDAYFLGVDEYLGGDPAAEMTAELKSLMAGDQAHYPHRSATEAAHIEVICERLRLLYVGMTRARRFLQISRSRKTRAYRKEYDAEPSTALGVLYQFVKEIDDRATFA
ncbi:MAG: ATP-dependent helicase [Ardenticatenaceae bacterium]|nr:ATP-dependent helicase [Ardenticatenaceae bacterium]